MVRVGRLVARELLRQGWLLHVRAEAAGARDRDLYLIRGQTELLDLTPLGLQGSRAAPPHERAAAETVDDHAAAEQPQASMLPPAAVGAPAPEAPSLSDLQLLQYLLQAMEQAQSLQVGGPWSGHRQVVLEGVLALLERALPGFRLRLLLDSEVDGQVTSRRVTSHGGSAGSADWARARSTGASFWISAACELPEAVRRLLPPGGSSLGDEWEFSGAAAVPLVAPSSVDGEDPEAEIGLLFLIPRHGWHSVALVRLAHQLADFVTQRWRQHLAVDLLIHSDSLTGVHNRAFFEGQCIVELERARRHDSPLALILADIDHFKQINDRYGHPAGDWVLKQVAQELLRGLRRIDAVSRIGGEEFALLLPDTPPAAAQEVCLRLLARVDRLRIPVPGIVSSLRVTLSYGGATFPEGGADTAELYRKADSMLYLSKRGGRNRCTFWNPHGEPIVLTPTTSLP
jgi:diguanylate cyclase (GGDEF)-like protein